MILIGNASYYIENFAKASQLLTYLSFAILFIPVFVSVFFHSFIKRCQTCNRNQKCWYYYVSKNNTQTHTHTHCCELLVDAYCSVPFEWFFHRNRCSLSSGDKLFERVFFSLRFISFSIILIPINRTKRVRFCVHQFYFFFVWKMPNCDETNEYSFIIFTIRSWFIYLWLMN